MNRDTLESIRRLAERPGTEAEGIVAHEMLKRFEGHVKPESGEMSGDEYLELIRKLTRNEITFEEYLSRNRDKPCFCPCDDNVNVNGKCLNQMRHLWVQNEIRARFKRGDRVVYNYHAYPKDCPGTVAAHVKLQKENGDYPWAWLSIKFDHLKSARQVPIISTGYIWCLEHVA